MRAWAGLVALVLVTGCVHKGPDPNDPAVQRAEGARIRAEHAQREAAEAPLRRAKHNEWAEARNRDLNERAALHRAAYFEAKASQAQAEKDASCPQDRDARRETAARYHAYRDAQNTIAEWAHDHCRYTETGSGETYIKTYTDGSGRVFQRLVDDVHVKKTCDKEPPAVVAARAVPPAPAGDEMRNQYCDDVSEN